MTQWGLDALFNPSKRHMDEEKARLQSTREEVGDASGGKRIDLDSGRVRISRTGIPEPVEADSPAEADTSSETPGASEDLSSAQTVPAIEASTATDDNAGTDQSAT